MHDTYKAQKILEKIHEGVYGIHANGHKMARQIMRLGYFWMTIERDCTSTLGNIINVKFMQIRFMSCLPHYMS